MNVTLRPCTKDDAELLLRWRNDPEIIAHSTRKVSVTRKEHVTWLEGCLAAPDTHRIFLIQEDSQNIGVIRFDRACRKRAEVSISLQPGRQGQGAGVAALVLGSREAFRIWPELDVIDAHVLSSNMHAASAFEKSGYLPVDPPKLLEHMLFRLTRTPNEE